MDEIPMAPFAAAIDEFRHLEFPDQLANFFRHRYNTIMILSCQARQENVFFPIRASGTGAPTPAKDRSFGRKSVELKSRIFKQTPERRIAHLIQ